MIFLLVSVLAGFVATLLLTPLSMEFLRDSGIEGIDQQKEEKPKLPTSGGIPVLFGFLVAISLFLGMTTFLSSTTVSFELILASLSATLIISLIGLIDDIHVNENGEKVKENDQISIGFRKWWVKPLFVVPAALPLMVVKAGYSTMYFPIIGPVEWGIFYPLALVPLGLVSVSNATNMLAGQNGLESSLGVVALTGLGIFLHLQGAVEASLISFAMASSLLAFLYFNKYPARILPGDSLTYAMGAAFASAVIIGNVEFFGAVIFIPWIAEAFLKLRSRFEASSLGELKPDGTLEPLHDSVYSLTHVLMRFDLTEPQMVWAATISEATIVSLALLVFVGVGV